MTEYIERQAALDALQAPEMFGITPYHIELINRIPAADVAPVIHGKPVTKIRTVTLTNYHEEIGILADDGANLYRKVMTHADIPYEHCPMCGATLCSRWHNYCGKCGAKMDLEVTDNG